MSLPLRQGCIIAALGAAALLEGCAQEAILELQVELPPAPPADGMGPWFAIVDPRPAQRFDFDTGWMGGDETPSIELTDAAQWFCVSVVSPTETVTDDEGNPQPLDLNVRVTFCRSEQCVELADSNPPERHFTLEHPFFLGRRTYWQTSIDRVPQCATDADCGGAGVCIGALCGCRESSDCGPGLVCSDDRCLRRVDQCDIPGCISGTAASYCSMDGRHFCETKPSAERMGSFRCGGE